MKFFDNTRTVDGFMIVLMTMLAVFCVTLFVLPFYLKSTCSLCKERHPMHKVTTVDADNNVTFKICRKCALEVFEEKIKQ